MAETPKDQPKDQPAAGKDHPKDQPKPPESAARHLEHPVPPETPDPQPADPGPGKPAPTPLADAPLSQPPSPPSLAQASPETRAAAMAKAEEEGRMGQQFTLWQKRYQIIHEVSAGVLVTEVDPANDPRMVQLISKPLVDEAMAQMQQRPA